MTEEHAHKLLVKWLDAYGACYCHVANEGKRSPRAGQKLKRMGVKRGVPDFLIFDKPGQPSGYYVGCAIELKAPGGKVSDEQAEWLKKLKHRGWLVGVCVGFDEAVDFLERHGYPR